MTNIDPVNGDVKRSLLSKVDKCVRGGEARKQWCLVQEPPVWNMRSTYSDLLCGEHLTRACGFLSPGSHDIHRTSQKPARHEQASRTVVIVLNPRLCESEHRTMARTPGTYEAQKDGREVTRDCKKMVSFAAIVEILIMLSQVNITSRSRLNSQVRAVLPLSLFPFKILHVRRTHVDIPDLPQDVTSGGKAPAFAALPPLQDFRRLRFLSFSFFPFRAFVKLDTELLTSSLIVG